MIFGLLLVFSLMFGRNSGVFYLFKIQNRGNTSASSSNRILDSFWKKKHIWKEFVFEWRSEFLCGTSNVYWNMNVYWTDLKHLCRFPMVTFDAHFCTGSVPMVKTSSNLWFALRSNGNRFQLSSRSTTFRPLLEPSGLFWRFYFGVQFSSSVDHFSTTFRTFWSFLTVLFWSAVFVVGRLLAVIDNGGQFWILVSSSSGRQLKVFKCTSVQDEVQLFFDFLANSSKW